MSHSIVILWLALLSDCSDFILPSKYFSFSWIVFFNLQFSLDNLRK